MNSVLLCFIDGLGIGARSANNPLSILDAGSPLAIFQDEEPVLPLGGVLSRTDANIGVPFRPQSASGQTTILTGVNAPVTLGYHKQGFPNAALREILTLNSVFLKLRQLGIGPNIFVNAYHPRFFEVRPRWVSATTVAVEAAQMNFRTFDDLKTGSALFHDYSNRGLMALGYDVPELSPDEAGARLAHIASRNRFTLFEYFNTDKIGHARDFDVAVKELPRLASFITSVVRNSDLNRTTIILTSDHGNIEDLSTRNHTRNQIPTIVWGLGNQEAASKVASLCDITPLIISLLSNHADHHGNFSQS
jgi:hypothetical protein